MKLNMKMCVDVLAHCTLCYFQQSLQSTLESVLISFTKAANNKDGSGIQTLIY